MIVSTSETGSISYGEVRENSSTTLRTNISGTYAFVKWEGDTPTSVSQIESKNGPYTLTQISDILTGSDWTDIKFT